MEHKLQVGKPVSGQEFIGREKEAKELITLIKAGQSVVLIAPRRFGKTSLMLKVLNELKSERIDTTYIDIFTTPDIKRLSESITQNILENRKLGKAITMVKKNLGELFKSMEFKSTIEDFEFILKFGQPDVDSRLLLEESIDFAEKYTKKYNTRLAVGLDEFGDIEKLGGGEIAKLFRAKMQVQENVCYLFSGSYESVMNQLFTTSKSPFYRFARIMELGYIEIDEFKKLYRQKLKSLGHEVNEFLITKILAFTQGHPYYSSLFLQQWTLQNDIPKDTEKAFEYLIETIITIEQPYMEKMWEEVSLSKDQRHLILSLAESKKPYSSLDIRRINVSRTISTLKNKGIILKKKDGYSFTDPIFEAWIRRNVLKDF